MLFIMKMILINMGTIVSGDDEVVMQVHNKEVHIGAGKGSTDVPKWVGYVDHKQFGTTVTTLQKEDAELKSPGEFPSIYKIVRVGSSNFGIQDGGTRIYKFTNTAFHSASYTQFVSTQGLCLVDAGTDIWLYDDKTAFGTLYKIDVSDWGTEDEISQESTITGWGTSGTSLAADFDISDIHDDGSKMWFAAYKAGTITHSSDWLFNINIPTSNATLLPIDRTPRFSAVGGILTDSIEAILYKQCLVKSSTWDGVGVLAFLDFNGGTIAVVGGSGTFVNGLCMFSVERTYTGGDDFDVTPSGGSTADLTLHEVINGGNSYDYGATGASATHYGGFYQDATRFFVAVRTSSTSTDINVYLDAVQAEMTPSSTHFSQFGIIEVSSDDVDTIDANGLCMTYDTDDNVLYMCENNGGGGYIDVDYDGITAFSDIDYLERSDIRVTFEDGDTGEFLAADTYFWKFAYMYDEYQESPLSAHFTYTPVNLKHIQLTIDLYNLSILPKRVSHLMVYRAEDSGTTGSTSPDSFYRLAKKVKLDTSFALITDGWGVDASGTTALDFRRHVFLDQLNNLGASYEARTLMPETLETSIVNYALSTQINSQHIVGKCYKTEISDPMNYLFKSKVNNFNQFDWTTDFLRLPTVPTALASFNGRIFVFDENNTYRINPQGFLLNMVCVTVIKIIYIYMMVGLLSL